MSLTDKTGPQPSKWFPAPTPKKKNAHNLGPRDTWDQTGFTGSAFSERSNLVGGRFTQHGPQDREDQFFWRFWPVSGPEQGRKISSSPQTPKNQANCEVRPQEAEPSKSAKCTKLRNAKAVLMGQKNLQKLPNGAELWPKRRPAGNIWFYPGSNLGPSRNI